MRKAMRGVRRNAYAPRMVAPRKTTSFRTTDSLDASIRAKATEEGIARDEWIRACLAYGLNEMPKGWAARATARSRIARKSAGQTADSDPTG